MRKSRMISFVTAVAIFISIFSGLMTTAGAASVPDGLTALTTDISINFDAHSGESFSDNTVICGGYVKAYATSDKPINADASKKTIDGVSYTTRMKMVGAGTVNGSSSVRVLEVFPGVSGTIQVDFAHASSSGDARQIAVTQNGSTQTQSVEAGATTSIIANVTAEESVYIYGLANINLYGIRFTAGAEAPVPTATAGTSVTAPPVTDPSGLTAISGDAQIKFDAHTGVTFSANTVICDGNVRVYAASGSTVNVDDSNKTIDGIKYSTRIKMGGKGTVNGSDSVRVLEVLPAVSGTIQVDFAHASSSGDAREIAITQNGNTQTQSVEANNTASITANVTAGASVYIYGLAGVNIYGIRFTAGAETTPTPTADPNVTPAPATPTPEPTAVPELQPMDYRMSFIFNDYSGATYTKDTLLANEDGDTCLLVHATSSRDVQVNASNKTIGGTRYTTRLRLRGAGSVSDGYRYAEMIPSKAGSLTFYFGHPSSSDTNPRNLVVQQGETIQKAQVASNSETTARFVIEADVPVYFYGEDDLGVYCIKYNPGDTATPPPSSGADTPEEAAKLDAESLRLNSLSQDSIYFDIDLPKTGDNGSEITWESSNSNYIDIQMISSIERNYTGVITRPEEDDANLVDGGVPVTLTATVTNGEASVKKTFDVSVRARKNVVYHNDFQQDVGMAAEGTYKEIEDNVTPATTVEYDKYLDSGETHWRCEPFRGIRIDTLKESRAFAQFNHNDKDTSAYFDKRLMSTKGTSYGNPADSAGEDENFVFYYSEYTPYGGSSTIPMWIELTDEETGKGPSGIVMMTMDVYVINGMNQFNIGLANSSPSQMCRFMLGADHGKTLASGDADYKYGGYLRSFNNEASVDFLGGTAGYRIPEKKWIKVTMIANTDSHKWDLYFDGMQIGTSFDFRNAEDYVSNIEFVLNRSYPRDNDSYKDSIAVYMIDNIYVENLTEDYAASYWDAVGIDSLNYDSRNDRYIAEAGVPFLLQYQGTEGLSGNYLTWTSSNKSALDIKAQRIAVEDLINYGYTQAQIDQYLADGVSDVSVIKATPGYVSEDTVVTLKATLTVGDDELTKEFKVLVTANPDVTPTPSSSTGSSSKGGGGGGSGSGSYSGISSVFTNPSATATPAPKKIPSAVSYDDEIFTDLYEAEWARDAILYLYSQDIVDGYGDGIYGVRDNVTREQFVKMLLTALDFSIYKNDAPTFSDVQQGAWYEYYVETAFTLGIVSGVSETEFGVGQPISRQDMAVMVKRALDYLDAKSEVAEATAAPTASPEAEEADEDEDEETAEEDTEAETADIEEAEEQLTVIPRGELTAIPSLTFSDSSDVASYAAEAVAEMADMGILNGYEDGSFRPGNALTRAETAVVLYKILSQEGK